MQNDGNPPDLFASLDFLAVPAEDEGATLRTKALKRRLREERNAENLALAIAAFEKDDWIAGLRFAEKTNMKDTTLQYQMGRFYEEGFSLERSPKMAAQ